MIEIDNFLPPKEKTTINLDLFVDESKSRDYKGEKITYIMIMAIPKDKEEYVYNKINNARCLNSDINEFGKCNLECKYHKMNDREIHFAEIRNDNVLQKIATNWIDILLNNNFRDEKCIYFNILGINENKLDLKNFGDEGITANIYCRFFRTALLRILKMFDSYDEVIVDNIYHDNTTEMENHKYFKKSAIRKISLSQIADEDKKFIFNSESVVFIDSNHKKGEFELESQFIQFVDLILGCVTNAIHNTSTNTNKVALTEKIYPLVSRILSPNTYFNKNSKYNYYNKQCISFFPKYNLESLKGQYGYLSEKTLEKILHSVQNFENTKELLHKINDGQMTLF